VKHLLPLLLIVALAVPAAAVTTSHWTQANEADFKAGKTHNVVATSLGHLRLSRSVKTLLAEEAKVGAVYALAEAPDGTVYAGTGPQGVLLRVKGDAVETLAELGDGVNISSLLVEPTGSLLIGTGGAGGVVYRLDHPDASGDKAGKPEPIFQADGVQYVWAMSRATDGTTYLATGPTGTLFELKPDGSHAVLLKTDENNLTCLATDGKDLLYVGSDTNGLVYRVNRRTRESFVLYNAAETEIGALAVDPKGNLFVGTSQASDQPPAADDETAGKEKVGHPEGGPGGVPIDSKPPAAPVPPPAPTPNPGQPDPIPKNMMILTDGPGDGPGGDPGTPDPGDPTPPPKPPATPAAAAAKPPATPTQQATNPATTGQPASNGNAVYRIDPDGFVTEVFRGPVLVLAMAAARDGSVLVATGSDGEVYQINPAADETAVVAHTDAKQVTALLPAADGRVMLGLSNTGGLAVMGSGYADTGTYTSEAFDAQQTSRFGKVQLHGTLPAGTTLTVSTRSGNTKEPTDAGWSPWSPEEPAAEFVPSKAPPARFFQYRLTFATQVPTATPVVEDADVAYLSPNLPPQVKSVKVTLGPKSAQPSADAQQSTDATSAAPPATPAPPSHVQTISWDASDPNNDPLVYAVYERQGSAGPWILLKDKLKDASYEWDTRGVADGRYELKVVASDEAANPVGQGKTASRVSDPVLIDNTPPVIGDVKTTVNGMSVTVTLRAVDAAGTVAAVDYAVDSAGDWQAATPSDTMFDSPSAVATLTAGGLTPGAHTIAVRVTDARGNAAFQNVTVNVTGTAGAPAVSK
jgi:sugar lactone lactonase YvrE